MSAAPVDAAADAGKEYDLYYAHDRRLRLRLTDRLLQPDATCLTFYRYGRSTHRRYADIRSVRLLVAHVPRHGNMGVCTIAFRDGTELRISSGSESGLPDPVREQVFSEFVADLHRRIIASGADRIAFTSGNGPVAQVVLTVALSLGALLFIATPLVLVVILGEWRAALPGIAGAAFLWPAYQAYVRNRPRRYDSRWPPDPFSN